MKYYFISWVYFEGNNVIKIANAKGMASGDNPTYQDVDDWASEIKESNGLEHKPAILFFKEVSDET